MMYMHYCSNCHRLHMLNGHKIVCPSCEDQLSELKLTYLAYVEMSADARQELLNRLQTEDGLKELATTYRMLKYSKWYKEQNKS